MENSAAEDPNLGLGGRILVAVACAAVGTTIGTLALAADACQGYSKAGWPGLFNGTLKGMRSSKVGIQGRQGLAFCSSPVLALYAWLCFRAA